MYGIALILILAVMGGAIAFIGDRLGTKVGKKKISLFGMRPRHTSMLMTVITGIFIVTATLGVMTATSKDVRTALFGMEKLKAELVSLSLEAQAKNAELDKARAALEDKNKEVTALDKSIAETQAKLQAVDAELQSVTAERDRISQELADASERYEAAQAKLLEAQEAVEQLEANKKTLEADLASLNEITAQLRKGLATVREGQVIYQAGEVVGSAVLSAGKPLTDAKQVLGGFLVATNASVLERLNIADKQLMVLWVSQIDFDQMAAVLSGAETDQVVRVVASGNIVYGEPVIARLEHYPNKLIYEKDTVIYQEQVTVDNSKQSETAVMSVLAKVNELAVKAGMLPDPLAGTVGSLRAADVFEASQAVMRVRGPVRIAVTAKNDIYTAGPLEVAIRISAVQ